MTSVVLRLNGQGQHRRLWQRHIHQEDDRRQADRRIRKRLVFSFTPTANALFKLVMQHPSRFAIPLKHQPKPSYSLALSPSAVDEGDSFRALIATKTLRLEPSSFMPIKGGVDADDFSGNAGLTGRVTIDGSGDATFTRKTIADKLTEGSETARVLLYSDSQRTVQVGDAASVTIRDTSKTPAKPSYSLALSPSAVDEGDSFRGSIATKNVKAGTKLFYAIKGGCRC